MMGIIKKKNRLYKFSTFGDLCKYIFFSISDQSSKCHVDIR
jgi:hypothetical protein